MSATGNCQLATTNASDEATKRRSDEGDSTQRGEMTGFRQSRVHLKPDDLATANELLSAIPPYPSSVPLADLDHEFGARTCRKLLNAIHPQFMLMLWRGSSRGVGTGMRVALSPAAARRVRLGFTLQRIDASAMGEFSDTSLNAVLNEVDSAEDED